MQLMNKNLWGIVKVIEAEPIYLNKLIEWWSRDDKEKMIIGLTLSYSELHHVDLDKSSKEIWENLNKLFGAQAVNAKISLKLQLFSFKMPVEATMSSHDNDLRSIIRQLAGVKAVVDAEDAKAILLNSLPPKYSSAIFTPSQLPSQSLDKMIASLLAEEKRTIEGDSQLELAFYARNNPNRSTKDKEEIECHYCKKLGHTTWNCRQRANDVLKGKFKDKQHIASVVVIEDPSYVDSGEESTEEKGFYAF
jgi:hypothetical protein